MFNQLLRPQLRCLLNTTHIRGLSQVTDSTNTYRIYSAIQPTGALHLGNYLGAIRQWIAYQCDHNVQQTVYCVADLHSLTTIQDKQEIRRNMKVMIASLIGCGLDPNRSVLYRQSDIPFHGQLCWILATLSTMPQLYRFPQFKAFIECDKTQGMKDIPLGLYLYPVLQVADILLFKSNAVPVGDDQIPHLNFARHLAHKFNTTFSQTFAEPVAISPELTGRIRSLRTADKKMSKSEVNEKSRIEITDSPDRIREKIRKAVTDMRSEVTYEPDSRPGVSNLVAIYSLISGLTPEEVCHQNMGRNTGEFKQVLSDLVVEHLKPIRDNVLRLMADESYLEQVLTDGHNRAFSIAQQTMCEVNDAIGSKSMPQSFAHFHTKINI
ncbi:unnamed protein product [Oppiella nova]|uniref:tryptophan--tRNA ligase n=1 Tax=Oppiella nova TaxID=334625 RepID=A0A7R9QKF0_9ACAR|nr:unnamed protein product [Oppiella nova]CAG2166764.1 unnamed protein product [Oppiella nova]